MTRVLHTADTHVGYQQYHEPERRADFRRAFEAVVEDAIAEDVDAVVHAGDLFHHRRPDLPDIQGVVAALRDLRAAEIPFLAVVGNHEAKRSGQWLDLFADLDLAERLDDEPRVVGDLALYGLDHVPQSRRDDLEYEFAGHDAERSALVAHGLFEPFDPGEWDTGELLEAATVDFDAMLLGDNHDPGKQRVEDTWVTYPGSTERASASERVDRGYNLVSVEDGDLRIARRSLETREFVFVDVELAPEEGADAVRDRVREYDHEDAVTVVTIEGDGEPVAPGPIEELARDRGALVARVNDRREVETEDAELEVRFADPDEAVRERVRELGLSEAARDLDRTIRDDGVADANVREVARRRVDEHREADLDAFEPVEDPDVDPAAGEESDDPVAEADDSTAESDDSAAESDDSAAESDGSAAESDDSTASDGESTGEKASEGDSTSTADGSASTSDDGAPSDGASTDSHPPDGTAAADDGESAVESDATEDRGDDDRTDATDERPEAADAAEQNDQASMEEYL